MMGLPIAIALGALVGKSEYQLEVLKDLTPEALEAGKQYIAEKRIDIGRRRRGLKRNFISRCAARQEGEARLPSLPAATHISLLTRKRKCCLRTPHPQR